MSLERKVSLTSGLKYRGGGPMLVWLLHRISGLGIILVVGSHVLASFFTQQFGSNWAIAVNTVYESFWFQILVVFFVLFHALNGLRIVILDFRPELIQYQREAIWLEWAVFIPLYGLTVYLIIQHGLAGG